ncbi:protein of unknown function [Legionella fallonii LLAP-10]|uniref:Uncharacterized protein n=1 Tax=Legionella fallonii LLAP-10 TaxID=1212491 RepID=A0A098G0V6_9GAMM|nr:protein of unknown function [Legionella fallonii LLAP-10]
MKTSKPSRTQLFFLRLFKINIPRINLFEHLAWISFYNHLAYSLKIAMNQLEFGIIV